jgi:DNA polymerase I
LLDWCRHIYRQHHVIYSTFHGWLDNVVVQARFDQRLESINRWPLAVHGDTRDGTLLNYPAQSGGADMMRHAAIAATEAGIAVCCSVHDSFKVLSPLESVERTCKHMDEIMRAAGAAITGSFEVPAELKDPVRYPARQADLWTPKDKGFRTWVEVQARLASGELRPEDNETEDDEAEETVATS